MKEITGGNEIDKLMTETYDCMLTERACLQIRVLRENLIEECQIETRRKAFAQSSSSSFHCPTSLDSSRGFSGEGLAIWAFDCVWLLCMCVYVCEALTQFMLCRYALHCLPT